MNIVEYQNVFLTRSGIGLKRLRLIQETIHHYKGKRRHFLLYALFQYFFKKKIKLHGRYLIIHNHWCPGYFHWITEALPRLFTVRKNIPDRILVLPDSFKDKVCESIDPFFKGEVLWIPKNINLFIDNLLIPENPPLSGKYDREILLELREIYQKESMTKQINIPKHNKIYVSRSKSTRRKVVNENELILLLKKNGFAVIHFEDYSFWEQVAMMHHTNVLISAHGAGLSNCLFMKPGNRVIELQKEAKFGEYIDVLYKDLAEICGLNYDVLYCQPIHEKESIYVADIIVNLRHFEPLVTNSGLVE